MKISVKDIPPGGVEFNKTKNPTDIGISKEDLVLKSALEISAHIERISNSVSVRAGVGMCFSAICSRCMCDIERDRNDTYTFNYMIEKGMDTVDLGEDIRQEIILGIPDKILCSDGCKGLCLSCGVNLNTESCECDKAKSA